MDKSLSLEQLKKDKETLERQIVAQQGALMYIATKLAELEKKEVTNDGGR